MTEQTARITLRQLLSHTSGLAGLDNAIGLDPAADDLVAHILEYGSVNDPGAVFSYSNVGAHVVGAVLAEATGQSVLDYARNRLFDAVGVNSRPAVEVTLDELAAEHSTFGRNQFAWAADRQGIHTGCCGLTLTAPDMINIGQLYLDSGNWQGSRIVSADWVRQSTTPHVSADQLAPDGGYGYLWWLAEQRGHRSLAAQGAFGQLILVVPDHKLVMAVASRDDEAGDIDLQPLIDSVVSALE